MAKIFKPDKHLVLFGAMNGTLYGDNSRHLYEWILNKRPDLHPIWLTRDINVYNTLKQQHKPVISMNSWGSIKYLAKARIGVFTNSLRDLALDPFIVPDTLQLIALRHGRSVKKVRFARVGHFISSKEAIERNYESKLIQYVISTSDFISDIQEQCLKIGRHKHIITGYPRNDSILNPTEEMRYLWEKYLNGLSPQKVVLYGPSWRHGRVSTRFFPFADFEKSVLINFLETRKILLLLRPHINDLRKYPELRSFLNNIAADSDFIRFASHYTFPDVNMILPFVDILISDYSALYHDFLLLDRPLIFVPYDYNDFANQNGFLYDYFKYLPGPAINNFSDFYNNLDQIYLGQDIFQKKRRALLDLIHVYRDSKSCDRVINLIDKLREKKIHDNHITGYR